MRDSPADFISAEVADGIIELHDGNPALCDGHHSTYTASYVEWLEAVKPGKPLSKAQRRAVRERVARVCWASQCPAYRTSALVLWQLASELVPQPRRKRPDSGG